MSFLFVARLSSSMLRELSLFGMGPALFLYRAPALPHLTWSARIYFARIDRINRDSRNFLNKKHRGEFSKNGIVTCTRKDSLANRSAARLFLRCRNMRAMRIDGFYTIPSMRQSSSKFANRLMVVRPLIPVTRIHILIVGHVPWSKGTC